MKILMVHPHDIYSPLEPWTIRVVRLACQLAANGHQVTLAHFPYSAGEVRSLPGVFVVGMERKMSAGAFCRNGWRLYQLARGVDVVHFQKSQFYAALPAVVAAYLAGRHLHYDWDDWEEKIFYKAIERSSLSTCLTGASFFFMERMLPILADSTSVASEALRQLVVARGADQSRVVWIPVGADLQQFNPGQDGLPLRKRYDLTTEILVFYHGQLHSCQYGGLFLEAIKCVCAGDQGRRMKFMIVGSGSDLNRLRALAQDLGVAERVIFTGFVPHHEVADYIAAADICVAPFEDNEVTRCKSPLKIVEYLASGKPVVASDVGEISRMLDGAGILVKPGCPQALAQGMLKLAQDKQLRCALSVQARLRAAKFNWKALAEKLEMAYVA
ncbi:MAG: glycosyltransferase family 4 protein [Candidatus Omnitrophota bacterium]